MTDEELVEQVARAIAPPMEGGRSFDQMPPDGSALRKCRRIYKLDYPTTSATTGVCSRCGMIVRALFVKPPVARAGAA